MTREDAPWRPLVDPECPVVQQRHGEAALPDVLDLLGREEDWEHTHREGCERCRRYGEESE